MVDVIQSAVFASWFEGLRDREAQARIRARIRRLSMGNTGDTKAVGASVVEMRIDYGPGYRVYFAKRRQQVVILLCGGDKRSQSADIKRALAILKDWE